MVMMVHRQLDIGMETRFAKADFGLQKPNSEQVKIITFPKTTTIHSTLSFEPHFILFGLHHSLKSPHQRLYKSVLHGPCLK